MTADTPGSGDTPPISLKIGDIEFTYSPPRYVPVSDLDREDAKLVVLARSARLRAYTRFDDEPAEGAAIRDTDGRTYAAATFGFGRGNDLSISALRAAVAAAVSSGARRFEAAAVVTEQDELDEDDLLTLLAFGAGVPVFLAGPDGVARTRVTS